MSVLSADSVNHSDRHGCQHESSVSCCSRKLLESSSNAAVGGEMIKKEEYKPNYHQQSRRWRVGYWVTEKKSRKLNFDLFKKACSAYNVDLFQLNFNRVSEWGKLDGILHKLSDVLLAAEADQTSQEANMCRNLKKYLDEHPNVVVMDPLLGVRALLDRYDQYSLIEKACQTGNRVHAFVPKFVELKSNDQIKNIETVASSGVRYPLVCKPKVAHGSDAHKLALVFGPEGLKDVPLPFVAQTFIPHNAILFKIYVIGPLHFLVSRPSLKNFSETEHTTIHFDSHEVSKEGCSSRLTEVVSSAVRRQGVDMLSSFTPAENLDERDNLPGGILPEPQKKEIEMIVQQIQEYTDLSLFGLDLIIDKEYSHYYIVDVNTFPSYDGIPGLLPKLAEFISYRMNKAMPLPPVQLIREPFSSLRSNPFTSNHENTIPTICVDPALPPRSIASSNYGSLRSQRATSRAAGADLFTSNQDRKQCHPRFHVHRRTSSAENLAGKVVVDPQIPTPPQLQHHRMRPRRSVNFTIGGGAIDENIGGATVDGSSSAPSVPPDRVVRFRHHSSRNQSSSIGAASGVPGTTVSKSSESGYSTGSDSGGGQSISSGTNLTSDSDSDCDKVLKRFGGKFNSSMPISCHSHLPSGNGGRWVTTRADRSSIAGMPDGVLEPCGTMVATTSTISVPTHQPTTSLHAALMAVRTESEWLAGVKRYYGIPKKSHSFVQAQYVAHQSGAPSQGVSCSGGPSGTAPSVRRSGNIGSGGQLLSASSLTALDAPKSRSESS